MFKRLSIFCFILISQLCTNELFASVIIRDSTVTWQHHRFSLNDNHSMASMTNDNNDIVQVQFEGKVIENDFFRIVLISEYGGRIISYFYKPTAHEYLYQSPCGTPYGIGDGNFYYDWLMVYGGIFPTFPESEHGKMWLKPWIFEVIKQTSDSVIISMSVTDNTQFIARPGQFNNGITGMICEVRIGVYAGRTNFTFDVKLTNPTNQSKKYEYWTCTTLTPGSDSQNTYSPLSSEIIVPATQYEAAWSPNSWIGKYGSQFDFSRVNLLSKWTDMGIGYVIDLTDDYWGVINHDIGEGFFRISDRTITKGLKLWTWGRNAANANPFLISNGGRDDYIELWGGVSSRFFEDAQLAANSSLSWSENYFPTIGLSGISAMNNTGGVFMNINPEQTADSVVLTSQFYRTKMNEHQVYVYLNDNTTVPVLSKNLIANPLGNNIVHTFEEDRFENGDNRLVLIVEDTNGEKILMAEKQFNVVKTSLKNVDADCPVVIRIHQDKTITFSVQKNLQGTIQVFSIHGKNVHTGILFDGKTIMIPVNGVYIVKMQIDNQVYTEKIVVK